MLSTRKYDLCYGKLFDICYGLNKIIGNDKLIFSFKIENEICVFYLNKKLFYAFPYRFFLSCDNMFIVRLLSDKFIKGI